MFSYRARINGKHVQDTQKAILPGVLICGLRCLPPPNIKSLEVEKGSHLSFANAQELLLREKIFSYKGRIAEIPRKVCAPKCAYI